MLSLQLRIEWTFNKQRGRKRGVPFRTGWKPLIFRVWRKSSRLTGSQLYFMKLCELGLIDHLFSVIIQNVNEGLCLNISKNEGNTWLVRTVDFSAVFDFMRNYSVYELLFRQLRSPAIDFTHSVPNRNSNTLRFIRRWTSVFVKVSKLNSF